MVTVESLFGIFLAGALIDRHSIVGGQWLFEPKVGFVTIDRQSQLVAVYGRRNDVAKLFHNY